MLFWLVCAYLVSICFIKSVLSVSCFAISVNNFTSGQATASDQLFVCAKSAVHQNYNQLECAATVKRHTVRISSWFVKGVLVSDVDQLLTG